MNIRTIRRRVRSTAQPVVSAKPLFLFLCCFAIGCLLGAVTAHRTIQEAGEELTHYLQTYLQVSPDISGSSSWLTVVLAYFRYPFFAFLFGFCSAGVVLLPLLSIAQGFFLSYAVFCFSLALGREQFLLILAVFCLRCLLLLPCTFWLLQNAWQTAKALVSVGTGRARPVQYGKEYYVSFLICIGVLLLGVLLEMTCVPYGMAWVNRWIMS